jgi:hypothetical protein
VPRLGYELLLSATVAAVALAGAIAGFLSCRENENPTERICVVSSAASAWYGRGLIIGALVGIGGIALAHVLHRRGLAVLAGALGLAACAATMIWGLGQVAPAGPLTH